MRAWCWPAVRTSLRRSCQLVDDRIDALVGRLGPAAVRLLYAFRQHTTPSPHASLMTTSDTILLDRP
jgi:hypothetical protein